ncbi:MAG: pyrimidine dimer DNA glycosylase/endonuclease V, partial [Gammaproteobacteria bacterium]
MLMPSDSKSKGPRYHPQLIRFKDCPSPMAAIAKYLKYVHDEATRRGYQFDKNKNRVPADAIVDNSQPWPVRLCAGPFKE